MRNARLLLASMALGVLLASGLAVVGVQEPAQAAFPGVNGRIAYSLGDDIHTVNPDGSDPLRLSNTPANDSAPAWSPNAKKIAFIRGSDIYVMNPDGSDPTKIPNTTGAEYHLSWSPDGSKLVFERSYDEIWKINADGSNPIKIGTGGWPDWSPDGTKIAFTFWDESKYDPEYPEFWCPDIYTMKPDGSDRAVVTTCLHNSDWAPDGQRLVARDSYNGYSAIHTFGGGTHYEVYGFAMDESVRSPAWSPDGAKVVFGRQYYCCEDENDGLAFANPDGSGLEFVTEGLPSPYYLDWGRRPEDWTAPVVVKAPTRNLVAGSAVGESTVPVDLAWSATDVTSGVVRYELQQSVNGGPFADVALPSGTTTNISPPLEAGKTYQYQVRAKDGSGNWSAWRQGPTFSVDLRQETHQAITYTGAWTLQSAPTASGGYLRYAAASGSRARFSFAGKHVAWAASTGSNRGKAEVWVDGVKVQTVDLYAPVAQPRKMVFTKTWTTSANHTVEVRVLGTKNAASSGKRVDVDAFVALR